MEGAGVEVAPWLQSGVVVVEEVLFICRLQAAAAHHKNGPVTA